ncbi:MAG: 2-oxoacid:acceptor oxidoreductase family protein [archaeon]
MTKIILIGMGGDGVKLLGLTLGNYLVALGYNLALTFSYDSAVRGGDIMAFLDFGNEKIENPIIDEADLMVQFSNSDKKFNCKNLITDEKVTGYATECNEIVKKPVKQFALDNLQSNKVTNMLMFGFLIKELGLDFKEEEIVKVLPPKFTELNLKAIKLGYEELQ